MEILKVSKIKLNPNNPRVIKDAWFEKLVSSIKEAPWMLELRPLVLDKNNVILGGNMRFRAAQKAGLKEIPVLRAEALSDEQREEFIIKDNLSYGTWDFEVLASDWDVEKLTDWGICFDSPAEEQKSVEYSPKFEVVIECSDEAEQKTVYDMLKGMNYSCRVLTI